METVSNSEQQISMTPKFIGHLLMLFRDTDSNNWHYHRDIL